MLWSELRISSIKLYSCIWILTTSFHNHGHATFSPLCARNLSDVDLKFGNLNRLEGSNGELTFSSDEETLSHLEIFLRLHPDKRSWSCLKLLFVNK